MSPCADPFTKIAVIWHDLTWPCKSPKFNLHHLQNISIRFKMAVLTLIAGILNLSAKSLKNTCKEICILESFSVSVNKIFEIYLWRNSFFQFTILLVTFAIDCNAPLLKCLTSISVNHYLKKTPWLFRWCIMKAK